jgi:protochlorophyllide reductase
VAEEEYELVVQQAALLSGLARAPARNIIVTGASSGVGLAGAKILTAAGHSVTLACRTQAKADAAARACMDYAAGATGGPATASPYGLADFAAARRSGGVARGAECNLAALSSVRSFAGSFTGPLDTLVLNAGLSLNVGDDKEQFTADGFELTVGTNHLGHFALADALLPTLAKGTKPRLVVTASGVHDPASEGGKQGGPDKWAHLGSMDGLAGGKGFTMADGGKYDPDKAYKDSKLANMLFMAEASRRYAGKVTVNAFSPGLIADPNGFFRNQNKLFANAFNGITQKAGVGETNDFAGSALAFLAVDPALEGKTAGWYDALPLGKHSLAKHAPSVEARDAAEAKRLWELSQKLVAV